MRGSIQVGDQVFVAGGGEEIGAVRYVSKKDPGGIVVWVENAGDFAIPLDAIVAVHDQKVVLSPAKLDDRLLDAIGHAHDAEQPTD